MANIPAQQRAGRNIGIESIPVFLQAAGAPEVPVTIGGTSVLMQGVDNALRTPFLRAELSGFVFGDSASDVNLDVFFVDDQNNEMWIATITCLAAAVAGLDISGAGGPFDSSKALNLGVGEKLIVRASVAIAP